MIKYRGLKNKLAFLLSLSLVMSPMTALGAEDTFDASDVQTVGEDVEQSGDETATEVTTETETDGMEEVTDESAEISDGAETAEDDAELIEDSSELAEEEDAFTEEESEVTGSESSDIGFEDEEEINGMVGYSESEVSDGHEDEDEYGIVFDNLDEVPEVPENVIREEAETALGADGVTTADSEKYIPIGHMSSEEYTNYHTRARQQSIKAGADASGKRKYINETCWGFATMGAIYAEKMRGIKNPKIGLLNMGTEPDKGNALVKETYPLLKSGKLNFIGNVEPYDVLDGKADVVVTDGYAGNMMLKSSEATAKLMSGILKSGLKSSVPGMIAGLLGKPVFNELKSKLDPNAIGAAPLLGVDGLSFVGHGGSNSTALVNGMKLAKAAADLNLISLIRDAIQTQLNEEGEN